MAGQKPCIEVTAGIIRKDGMLLITRRPAGTHLEGLWEFPGGKREPGESLRKCLKREIMEELGLDIETEELLLRIKHEYETKIIDLYIYDCRILGGTPEPLDNQEIEWVRQENLDDYIFPPPDKKIIELIRHHSNSSDSSAG